MAARPPIATVRSAASSRRWAIVERKLAIEVLLLASVEDESVITLVGFLGDGLRLTGRTIDTVEPAEENGGWIARIGVAIIGPRQLVLGHRVDDVRRHQHDEFALVVDVVAALEQRA